MGATIDLIPNDLWKLYETWCKAENATPRLKDFMVWVDDQDIDVDAEDWS